MRDRRVVLGESEGVPGRVGVEAQQPRRGRRGAEAAPGAARVVAVVAGVQRDAGPDRDLVADDDGGQQLLVRRVGELGGGERGGYDDGAGMALREPVPVVEVQDVREHPVAPGRADGADPAAVEQRGRLVAGMHGRRVGGGERGRGCRPARDADHREVGEQQPDVLADRAGNVGPAQVADELDLRRSGHAASTSAEPSTAASAALRPVAAATTAAHSSSS